MVLTLVIHLSGTLVTRIDWEVGWKLKTRLHLTCFRHNMYNRFLSLSLNVILDVYFAALNMSRYLIKIPESLADVPALLQIFKSR